MRSSEVLPRVSLIEDFLKSFSWGYICFFHFYDVICEENDEKHILLSVLLKILGASCFIQYDVLKSLKNYMYRI